MIYTFKELLNIEKTRQSINNKLKNKELFRIDKGIYSYYKVVNPLLVYSKKYPYAIATLDTAFYYYGLTDVIPSKYYLATKQKAKPIKDDCVVQIYSTDELLMIGKTQVDIDGVLVNMYDRERLLIELIRRKKQMPLDYYKEIINNYRLEVYKLDMQKIEEYASKFNSEEHILDAIQLEVM